jgi:hypothetical protein
MEGAFMEVLTREDLDQLDRELGLDEWDELDYQADLLEELADLTGKELEELAALTGASGIVITRLDNPGRLGAVRRCADCTEPAMTRKGQRGPHPKRCQACTSQRKRWLDSGGSKAREPYKPCCLEWRAAGNRGLCPQHEDSRDETRRWDEAAYFARTLTPAKPPGGFHIWEPRPRGFMSARGPWEGRTRPDVASIDPYRVDSGREWLGANKGWQEPKSLRVVIEGSAHDDTA